MKQNEDGTLSYGTVIDTSGFDEGAEHIEQKIADIGESVENESSRINEIINNIPELNIDVVSNASQTLDTIKLGFQEIDNIIDANHRAIEELEAEYNRLKKASGDAFKKKDFKASDEYLRQAQNIKSLIFARKEAIKQAESEARKLQEVEDRLQKESQELRKTTQSHETLRQKIKALKEEMADLIANGIDEQSDAYKRLSSELGRLTDIQGDIAQQGKVLADDEQQIAGLIQGLGGLSGAFSAAQGAVALFGDENEDLQKIMLKVQSLMAITMGLQQIQQTLNKDSAFQLVTLNGLREWWNKLLAIGAGEATTEAAATSANAAAQGADAAATTANAAAKEAKAGASSQAAIAEGADTAATATNAAAATAGTAANISLAGAFRMVGAAISSIPVFGWIAAAIGVLIGVISHFVSEANKANEEFKESQKLLEDARKKYAEASVEIENYSKKIEAATGNQKKEKQLVDELNSKYGSAMGYYKSLSEWKRALAEKGEAYCQKLLKEAEAQAILNKYTEAFIHLQEVRDTKASEFGNWTTTAAGDNMRKKKAVKDAEDTANVWLERYRAAMSEAQNIADKFDLNPHIDPSKTTGGSKSAFDPKAAARAQKEAMDSLTEAVKKFNKDAQSQITDYTINSMSQNLAREITEINRSAAMRREAWQNSLRELAKVAKETDKQIFLSKKGNTLDMWENSENGKKSIDDYVQECLKVRKIRKENNAMLEAIENERLRKEAEARQNYVDSLIDNYGTAEQRMEKLEREWAAKIASIPEEYLDGALKQMNSEISKLGSEAFKDSINWESVFGDMGKQSIQTLQHNLDKIKAYFEQNKSSMDAKEIKDYQEAIVKMEDEIASRNPFAAFHKSLKDITDAKTEFTAAMQEWKDAQDELTAAKEEYNAALEHEKEVQVMGADGQPDKETDEYKEAVERLSKAKIALTNATSKNNNAEQKALNARNNITVAYKNFATQLRNVNGVVQGLGGDVKNLAEAFGSDMAKGIGKALDTIDAVINAASNVIDAISDVGKGAAEGVEKTVEATAQGAEASAAAGAAAISTIEKASVILAVISAALQVATAIANLFNDDDEKQEEIENLQRRIDQLQWELDNQNAVRLQNRLGDAVQRVRDTYAEVYAEVARLHAAILNNGSIWQRLAARQVIANEAWEKSIERIADAYAKASYTADKALGKEKFMDSRKQLENLAEQQLLIMRQIDEEKDKKDTDWGRIEDWQRDIQELAEQMATIINDMLEEIIGASAEDLATQLGDAFIEAASKGEDAMEAWHSKVKEIVADVMKRMIISKFLEEPLGQIFDKYKKKWFGDDGQFRGIDSVIDAMTGFSNDLNQVGTEFQQLWNTLPDSIKDWFAIDDEERSGAAKGIATASQESVDENNARLTTIQGHTYSLVQGMNELNSTTNTILERVTGIERNTSTTNDRLNNIDNKVKSIKESVDDIYLKGIKLR